MGRHDMSQSERRDEGESECERGIDALVWYISLSSNRVNEREVKGKAYKV